jgi:hypothetical protein
MVLLFVVLPTTRLFGFFLFGRSRASDDFLHKTVWRPFGSIVSGAALLTRAQSAPPQASSPGALADGSTLLPSGWRLAPAGRHLMIGDLPLNVVQSPDSRYLIVTNNGLAKPSFSVVDVANWTVKSTMPLEHAGTTGIPTAPGSTSAAGRRMRCRNSVTRTES